LVKSQNCKSSEKQYRYGIILVTLAFFWFFLGPGLLDKTIFPQPRSQKEIAEDLTLYPANSRSKIFHREDCMYVEKISEENYKSFFDRDDAVKEGYRPCKKCKP
jgi:hypothetical protein